MYPGVQLMDPKSNENCTHLLYTYHIYIKNHSYLEKKIYVWVSQFEKAVIELFNCASANDLISIALAQFS